MQNNLPSSGKTTNVILGQKDFTKGYEHLSHIEFLRYVQKKIVTTLVIFVILLQFI